MSDTSPSKQRRESPNTEGMVTGLIVLAVIAAVCALVIWVAVYL